ncbi:MAG TPA: DUF4426 domain-containing protein [Oceanospirillales bacterium]|nr:hypothetical protein [Oceanospirillaceae bacterium]HBS41417.1 DUF4426 domain-containing protein [Oceanospirillales bacterium]|tara:strand:- start:619 stop:1077 length:459 start_codon:yes stop_codon:yes gene_type:complete
MKTLTLMLSLLLSLPLLSLPVMASDRGEQKQVFGDYEVHYIGLTSNFIDEKTAQAYDIPRSRQLGYLSISVLKTHKNATPTPVRASVSGTIKNLIGQTRDLELREISETGAVYYITTFPFHEEEVYRIALKVTPEGQTRTYDVNFSQKFYEE